MKKFFRNIIKPLPVGIKKDNIDGDIVNFKNRIVKRFKSRVLDALKKNNGIKKAIND